MLDAAERARASAQSRILPWMRHVLVFGLLLALFLLLIARNVSPEPYGYDETDYMYAASLGFTANWTDTPSLSLSDFLGAGLHRGSPRALSERIRGSHDVLFYRHFHGPLYYYFLIPASRLGLSEHGVRTLLLAIPAASLAVIYFGCLWLVPGRTALTAALLAGVLFLTSHSVVWSTELAAHQLFALCTLACLILLLKAISTGRRTYWYACVIAAGLAFCALEVAFVLILTVAICGFVEWGIFRADLRFVWKSLALFLATVLAVWPAAILRLSFVKAYAVMGYLALLRESPWGHVGFIETWRGRFFESPMEWSLIAIALLLAFRRRGPSFYPLWMFAALMIVATLRVFSTTPRYALPFMPVLDLLAGLTLLPTLGPLRRPASFAVVALALTGLYGIAWFQVAHRPRNSNPRSAAVVKYIHQNEPRNKQVFATVATAAGP
jgi:4-amino-4-deoxy-L-arabinose transferase-like glycosyltransferase